MKSLHFTVLSSLRKLIKTIPDTSTSVYTSTLHSLFAPLQADPNLIPLLCQPNVGLYQSLLFDHRFPIGQQLSSFLIDELQKNSDYYKSNCLTHMDRVGKSVIAFLHPNSSSSSLIIPRPLKIILCEALLPVILPIIITSPSLLPTPPPFPSIDSVTCHADFPIQCYIIANIPSTLMFSLVCEYLRNNPRQISEVVHNENLESQFNLKRATLTAMPSFKTLISLLDSLNYNCDSSSAQRSSLFSAFNYFIPSSEVPFVHSDIFQDVSTFQTLCTVLLDIEDEFKTLFTVVNSTTQPSAIQLAMQSNLRASVGSPPVLESDSHFKAVQSQNALTAPDKSITVSFSTISFFLLLEAIVRSTLHNPFVLLSIFYTLFLDQSLPTSRVFDDSVPERTKQTLRLFGDVVTFILDFRLDWFQGSPTIRKNKEEDEDEGKESKTPKPDRNFDLTYNNLPFFHMFLRYFSRLLSSQDKAALTASQTDPTILPLSTLHNLLLRSPFTPPASCPFISASSTESNVSTKTHKPSTFPITSFASHSFSGISQCKCCSSRSTNVTIFPHSVLTVPKQPANQQTQDVHTFFNVIQRERKSSFVQHNQDDSVPILFQFKDRTFSAHPISQTFFGDETSEKSKTTDSEQNESDVVGSTMSRPIFDDQFIVECQIRRAQRGNVPLPESSPIPSPSHEPDQPDQRDSTLSLSEGQSSELKQRRFSNEQSGASSPHYSPIQTRDSDTFSLQISPTLLPSPLSAHTTTTPIASGSGIALFEHQRDRMGDLIDEPPVRFGSYRLGTTRQAQNDGKKVQPVPPPPLSFYTMSHSPSSTQLSQSLTISKMVSTLTPFIQSQTVKSASSDNIVDLRKKTPTRTSLPNAPSHLVSASSPLGAVVKTVSPPEPAPVADPRLVLLSTPPYLPHRPRPVLDRESPFHPFITIIPRRKSSTTSKLSSDEDESSEEESVLEISQRSDSDEVDGEDDADENPIIKAAREGPPVISLCHVQTTDSFASVGEDLSLCLWDFSSSKLQKQYTFSSPDLPASIVSDPLGLIVSVGTSKGEIHSFDIRMLEFLLGLDSNTNMFVHNSTTFNPLTHPSLTSLSFDSFSFTPDSRFLLCTPPVTDNSPSLSVSLYDIQTWSYVESLPLLADSEIEKISDSIFDQTTESDQMILLGFFSLFQAELISVQVLTRHGDRFPQKQYPAPLTQWPDLSTLTAVGMQQHYKLGQTFREHYKQYFPENSDNASIYIRSSPISRTLLSARSQMLGLYPYSDEIEEGVPKNFPTIPIETILRRYETVLRGYETCRNAKSIIGSYRSTDKYTTLYTKYKTEIQRVAEIIKTPIVAENEEYVWDAIYVDILKNREKMPQELIDLYEKTTPYRDQMLEDIFANPDPLFRKTTCGSFYETVFSLNPYLDTKNSVFRTKRQLSQKLPLYLAPDSLSQEKFFFRLYSGHDTTLNLVMRALGSNVTGLPYYGSAFIIELHKRDGTPAKGKSPYFFKFFYNTSEEAQGTENIFAQWKPTQCDDLDCDAAHFLKDISQYFPTNYDSHRWWTTICNGSGELILSGSDSTAIKTAEAKKKPVFRFLLVAVIISAVLFLLSSLGTLILISCPKCLLPRTNYVPINNTDDLYDQSIATTV
ncbi:hypothetical protein BLNAU_12635 [Blattamonas nauphoetae]|uniref:Acid phosphatase n=1 Tax=Blattamonas nauphoetae TaxID=2049346 RepID=A0ABQ9XIX4_9EUKA|nr:hypothetical protein BLNAU_12635 [Blattamonas nauphoetae]